MGIKVVTICGSMRYAEQMLRITEELELLQGFAVIQYSYNVSGKTYSSIDIATLAKSHRKKIAISDAIYVVNISGYIGNSTRQEIEYALSNGKEVMYHEPL